MVVPMLANFAISLFKWNLLGSPRFIGMGDYLRLVADPTFWTALLNTMYFTVVTVPISLAISVGIALLLNRKIRLVPLWRAIYLLPAAGSPVALALLWTWLYAPSFGLINYYLSVVGLTPPAWLANYTWAMPAIIQVSVWFSIGFNVVVYLAGLQSIAPSVLEAAAVDGARTWSMVRHIVLPALKLITVFVGTISVLGGLQVFTQMFIMTNGGPGNSTLSLVYYIYEQAFENLNMGYAATVSVALFLVSLAATVFAVRIIGTREETA